MRLNKKFIAVPAIALAAGLSLAACGSQSASASHAAAPAATHSVAAALKPTINYGQQYLADIASYKTTAASLTDSDTITSPHVIAVGDAAATVATTLLQQTWPANVQADIHTLATDALTVNADIKNDDLSSLQTDAEKTNAQANVVRTELGLPAA